AFLNGVIGGWALVAPRSFYGAFPTGGVHWVDLLPPYNEHLVTDFGGLVLGNGVVLTAAAASLSRPLVVGALSAQLMTAVTHYVFHATHLDGFSTRDAVEQTATLTLQVLLLGSL